MIRLSWVRSVLRGLKTASTVASAFSRATKSGRTYQTAPEPVPLRPHLLALHVAGATPWLRARNDNLRPQVKRRPF